MTIFDNLITLTKISSFLQWAVIILIFLSGSLQMSKWFIDGKINTLKNQMETKKEGVFKSEIGGLQKTIKEQEDKLGQIHEGVKNRQIPENKIPELISGLSLYRGEQITITNVLGDQEAFAFANQLKLIFEKAGWKVNGVNQAVYSNPIRGLIIVLKDKALEQKAQHIFIVLESAGFHCRGEMNEKMSENIGLVIGAK